MNYTVGEVAQRVGCSPASIRLWEREGLISPRRSSAGYRLFEEEDLHRLRHIDYLRNVEKLNLAGIRRVLGLNGTEASPQARSSVRIGPALRRMRREKGLTLEQVASKTAVSASFLSALEREQSGVSVATLKRILNFYGTTLAQLTAGGGRRGGDGRLTRSGKRRIVSDRFNGVTIEELARGTVEMEAQLFTVEPGGSSQGGYSHQGEEFIYVLDGIFEVELAGAKRYRLRPGDCLYFPSTLEHDWHNPGSQPARLLWVNTPPTF